ncbi:MAG: hypothetical protein K2R93_02945 [Gemmatimonadaceae bacterium]|nr:hypothetical protein [Gemmatimonadaceae bacterium]
MTNQIILKIGAEGGSLKLYGHLQHGQWRFSGTIIDDTGDLVGLPSHRSDSSIVETIEEALALLDRYPWQALYPLEIHPEFCEAIIARAAACGGARVRAPLR